MENETQKPEDKITKIQAWENVIKGWVMSLFGLIVLVADLGYLLHWWPLYAIAGIDMKYQIIGSVIGSVVLFAAPNDFISKCKNILTGFTLKP